MEKYYNYNQLVRDLVKRGFLKTPHIIKAFYGVDRKDFVLPEYSDESYGDYPLPIGEEQTISQPSTVAFMLELLQPREGETVLDVGAGSGWTTALLAEIVGERGFVYGVELVPELVRLGRDNLAIYGFDNAEIYQASPNILGLPDKAPFDKILVSAAGDDLPDELIDQLKIGGRMVIPVAESIIKVDKLKEDEINEQRYPGFAFVPLKY